MNTPLISIIVPVYKVPETYLRQCIESCINQTLTDIEIILVDDGSPDDCGIICDEYAAHDGRIVVVHKENGGLVSARNAGFDIISSKWHMYLDGDDWLDSNACESLIRYVEKYAELDVVFWKYIQELGDKSIKGKNEWRCTDSEHLYFGDECKEIARNVLVYKSGIATAYCKLINTEYAKRYRIKHDSRLKQGMEGVEFSLRCFYNANNILFVNAYWNHYLFNPDSISKFGSEYNAKCITECIRVIEEDITDFPERMSFTYTLYQRTVYAIIATALSTFFHVSSKDNIFVKVRKFSNYLDSYPFYKNAIYKCPFDGMDRQRILVVWILKARCYFMLQAISSLKAHYLKKGKFDY